MIHYNPKNILKNYRELSNINYSSKQSIGYSSVFDNELNKNVVCLTTTGEEFPCIAYDFGSKLANKNYAIVFKYKFTTDGTYTTLQGGSIVSFTGRNNWEVVGVNSSTYMTNKYIIPSNKWTTQITKISRLNAEYSSYSQSFTQLSITLGWGSQHTKELYISDIAIYEISDNEYNDNNWVPYQEAKQIKTKINNTMTDVQYIKTRSENLIKLDDVYLPSEDMIVYTKNGSVFIDGTLSANTSFNIGKLTASVGAYKYKFTASVSSNLNGSYFVVPDDTGSYCYLSINSEKSLNVNNNITNKTLSVVIIAGTYDNVEIKPMLNKGTVLKPYQLYMSKIYDILPSEYQRLDYIESTGTQYIDTNIPQCDIYKTDVSVAVTQFKDSFFIGSYQSLPWAPLRACNQYFEIGYKDNTWGKQLFTAQLNTKYKCETILSPNLREFKVDGTSYYHNDTLIYQDTSQDTALIFCYRYYTSKLLNYGAVGKLYNCKIYTDATTLVRDFIPCYRKLDNITGLYDLVNNVFYISEGTDNFIAGPKV